MSHELRVERLIDAEIKSRFYSGTGDTLDYTYELKGDTLTSVLRGHPERGRQHAYRHLVLPRRRRLPGDLDQDRVAAWIRTREVVAGPDPVHGFVEKALAGADVLSSREAYGLG